MAKLQDKFFNRVIEGDLELGESENSQVVKAVEDTSALKVFENIVDKDGHPRFIDGDITIETTEGVAQTYGKWSLSGTHLMIVLGLSYTADTALTASQLICKINNLPKWVFDKIIPLFANFVLTPKFQAWNTSGSVNDFSLYLKKETNELQLVLGANFNYNTDRAVRCEYDLLIDNE